MMSIHLPKKTPDLKNTCKWSDKLHQKEKQIKRKVCEDM